MSSAIEKELVKATGLKRKNREDSQAWYARLTGKVGDLEQDDWDALTAPAQEWSNKATRAVNDSVTIESFGDDGEELVDEPPPKEEKTKGKKKAKKAEPEEEAEEEAEDEEEEPDEEEAPDEDEEEPEEEEAPKAKRGSKKVKEKEKEPVAAKATTKTKANGKKKPKVDPDADQEETDVKGRKTSKRPVGSQTAIKQLLLKDPDASVEDLLKKLESQGFAPSKMAVSSIRSGFRHSLKVIIEAGGIPKGLSI